MVFDHFIRTVLVKEPWPMPHLLVPIGSDVEINCTARADTTGPLFWTIDLAADSNNIQHQFATAKEQLNTYGVYQLIPPIETPLTLRLLINDTAINNQTEINFFRGAQSTTTILHVFGESDCHKLNTNLVELKVLNNKQTCTYIFPGRSNSTNIEDYGCWCQFYQPHMGLVRW